MTDTQSKIEAAKSKIRKALISVAVMAGVGAPSSANAQGFRLERIGSGNNLETRAATQQQSVTRTAPQSTFTQVRAQQYQQSQDTRAQQALWNSLPTHVKNKIQSKGYQIDVEYSVGLNNALTPESQTKYAVMYSVACRSAKLPGKIIYLPYYETYPNNPRSQVQVRIVTENSAALQQAQDTGPYRAELNRFPTHTYSISSGKYGVTFDNKGRREVRTPLGTYSKSQNNSSSIRIRTGSRGW